MDEPLSDEQRAVVMAPPGPTLVIAGAGSGKTRALTFRVARLLRSGVRPERILLATFTNRAAREMCQRVERLTSVDTRGLWAGTFHHLGCRVLRRFGPRIGLDPRFGLLDPGDARDLLGRCLDDQGGRGMPSPATLQKVLSLAAGSSLTVADALAAHAPRFAAAAPAIARVADAFQHKKAEFCVLDFDDLLVLWKLLLVERDDVRRELEEEIAHVLVDEYQDVNPLQADLMERSASGSGDLLVVGDDAQSIYRFRGAEIALLIDFPRRFPNARVLRLETNYRSTPEIVALANRSIAGNRRQLEKTLRAVRPSGGRPAAVVAEDAAEEARFVGERIAELIAEGRAPGELAVLYRSHAHSLEVQLELVRRRLSYVVRSGPRLFEQAHVKDAMAYLRVLHNGRDQLAWTRLFKLISGLGARGLAEVHARVAVAGAAGLFDPTLSRAIAAGARAPLGRLAALMESLAETTTKPGEILRRAVAEHYRPFAIQNFPDAAARLDELAELAAFGDRFSSLERLLTDLSLVASAKSEGVLVDGRFPTGGALTLSTIHQAKGLEWPCVFVLHLSDGHFPPGVTLRGSPDEEEERRLFYVAVTRARDQLYLCRPERAQTQRGVKTNLLPSRFLVELAGEPLCEPWRVAAPETPGGAKA